MKQSLPILISIFLFSACHPQIRENMCLISVDEVLSCLASSKDLTTEDIATEFKAFSDSIHSESPPPDLNRLLCLSLHSRATVKQMSKGEDILLENIQKTKDSRQSVSGLLYVVQRNVELQKKYLDKNWNLYLKEKKSCEELEAAKSQLDTKILSYQRRIQDLEQQVQKLKEIESMLDTKTHQPQSF